MIDDWLLSLIYASWLAGSTLPLGLMLGSPCSPCCGCGVADGKPRTDPKDEGTWVPSGTWRGVGGVTWTFTANPGDDSGETWFFYGSTATSGPNAPGASVSASQDWGNLCNWYSSKTTSPSTVTGLPASFDKRATRLPPNNAVVHAYTGFQIAPGNAVTVKHIYFWRVGSGGFGGGVTVSSTLSAHDSAGGAVVTGGEIGHTINGGATFCQNSVGQPAVNRGTINDGATFAQNSRQTTDGTVNGGATFHDSSSNGLANFGTGAVVNGGATFNDSAQNFETVNDGANFNDTSENFSGFGRTGTVNGSATFNDSSINIFGAVVNDGATFNDNATNGGTVSGGGTFNNSAVNGFVGTVNGGATFNDAACSLRTTGSFFDTPCTRKFVAHPTDLPTCNGTAPDGCANAADTCGCG